jgi:hypothetical protein
MSDFYRFYAFHHVGCFNRRQTQFQGCVNGCMTSFNISLLISIIPCPAAYFNFVDYIFNQQSLYYNAAFFNKTQNDLYNLLGSAVAQFGIDQSYFFTYVQTWSPSLRALSRFLTLAFVCDATLPVK